jgi:hypothetical protein
MRGVRHGGDGRSSAIKRRHGLRHCRSQVADGPAGWVGLGVIANNLMRTATFIERAAHRIAHSMK